MENVSSVFMNIDTFNVLAVDIAPQMRTNINYQASLSLMPGFISGCCTIDACANYQKIVFLLVHNN